VKAVWWMDGVYGGRGATTAEKLRGTNVWVPNAENECGRGSPLPLWGSGGITPENF